MMKDKHNETQAVENNELSLENLEEVNGGFSDINFAGMENPGLSTEEWLNQHMQNNRPHLNNPYAPNAEEQAKREEAQQKLIETILGGVGNIANGASSGNPRR